MTTSVSNALIDTRENKETLALQEEIKEEALDLRQRQPPPKPTLASQFIVFWICATIIVSTVAFGTVHNWSLALFYCGAMFVGLLWVADAWRTGVIRYNSSLLQLPLIGVILLGLFQLLPLPFTGAEIIDGAISISTKRSISLDPFATRMAIVQITAITIFFAAALAFFDTHSRLNILCKTIIVFGFLLALFGLIQKFTSPTKIFWIREPFQAYPFGPFVNSGHFAACMEMILSLTLGVLFSGGIEKDQRIIFAFMALMMFLAMMMTGSRGAFLLSILIVGAILVTREMLRKPKHGEEDFEHEGKRDYRPLLMKFLLSVGVGASVIILMFGVTIFLGGIGSVSRIFNYTDANHPAGGGRLHYWSTAFYVIKDHPVFGEGLEGFGVAFTKYDTLDGTFRVERAHNDYIQVMADTGLVGCLLALSFILLLFRTSIACYKNSKDRFRRGACMGALIGCGAVLIHSFFEFPLRTTSNALLFLIFAVIATAEIHTVGAVVRKRKSRRELAEEKFARS